MLRLLISFFRKQSRVASTLQWECRGPTPLGEKKFTPQGLVWINGKLIFANTWKNERSRVYEFDPETMEFSRTFDMPLDVDGKAAVHTSGLAWDGTHLWGVDFKSNLAYCMDLERSLADGQPSVVGYFDTTLKGTSACCFVDFQGERYLAISDFMNSSNTIFVESNRAIEEHTAKNAIRFSYRNEGFSQGLEFFNGYLWESENKIGIDVVNKMDLSILEETRDAQKSTVTQFNAPSKMVEDLAWDGEFMWTSDESDFNFYKCKIDDQD